MEDEIFIILLLFGHQKFVQKSASLGKIFEFVAPSQIMAIF